jgi:hypothetical protein
MKWFIPFFIAFLFAGTGALRADEKVCSEAEASALQTVDFAFDLKRGFLLQVAKALQDKGADPRHHPVLLPNGTEEVIDLPEAVSTLARAHADAVEQIHKATVDCLNNSSGPGKISALAAFLSTDGLSLSLWPSVLAHDDETIIIGHPFEDGEIEIPHDPNRCSICPVGRPLRGRSALDEALDKLIAANIAFNNPQRMTVNHARIIEVQLSTKLSPEELKAQLTEVGSKETAGLKVGDSMSVTLNGGAAFQVAPAGPQVQGISRKQVTTWKWNVTPKMLGTQYLILSFDAIITLNGKDAIKNVRTLTEAIEVEVGLPETPGEWFELSKKWFENISWLWATLFVPIGIFVWRRWTGQKRDIPQD